ncbi:MAG: hypothetical protein FWF14_02405 [Streptococcaceae bacterium]|nr:hypothetical protein [Streptococcaceae bacterium]
MANFFKDMKDYITTLRENVDDVKANLERVNIELEHTKKTQADIQRKINEFQVETQPRLDKINEINEIIAGMTPENEDENEK